MKGLSIRIAGLLALLMAICSPAYAVKDTISVFFALGQSSLTEIAKGAIDTAIYNDVISERQPLQIIGYTDELGTDESNLKLSRARAQGIKTYLIASGFRRERITVIIGKGEANAQQGVGPEGNQRDRRVDIVTERIISKPQKFATAKTPVAKTIEPIRFSTTDLGTLTAGQRVVLDNIYFYPGQHIVRRESSAALETLYGSLTANPKVRIRIEGHVCCISAANPDALDEGTGKLELSVNRARAIRDYLIDRGIPQSRVEYIGYGRKYPVEPNERTEEDADKNRRVEIRVIE